MTVDGNASLSRTESGSRQWSKTAQTQAEILAAAEAVFIESGYTAATIAEVIERAGSSVGSVYHHFGGKAELYLALWEQGAIAREREAAKAVTKARKQGADNAFGLFEVGGRAYLRQIWKGRKTVAIFRNGDSPPGFEISRNERSQAWITRNVKLLGLGDSLEDRFIGAVFTSLVGAAERSIIQCTRLKQADAIIDEALRIAGIIYSNR